MISIYAQILLIILFWNGDCQIIPRIEECGLSCSQGIHCKSKPSGGIFNSFCHDAPASLSSMVLKSMKISTVMKCVQGSPCSLHLNIKGTLNLDENVRGLEICSFSLDTQQSQCINVRIVRKKSKMLDGKKVQIQFNCIEVSVAQHIYVTMKTVPHYCEVKLSQQYYVEVCGKVNLHCAFVPVALVIACRFSPACSLCLRWSFCFSVWVAQGGTRPVNCVVSCLEVLNNVFPLSLCTDTQVLWDDIVYNPLTQTLAWEPVCPVLVMVNLCRFTTSNDHCEDIENTFKNSAEKVR
ncbi:I17EL protein, partial [Spelaeornis formosus]|nr:I17EL protein [Elachura formosa]